MRLSEIADSSTMTLWHGGRGLQFNHMEMLPAKHGRWEYGPGLYLTTHYDTARSYAKGGGSVYKVVVEKGTELNTVDVPLEDAIDFVKRYAIGKHRKDLISDLQNNLNRSGVLKLYVLINLCVNYECLSPKNTVALRKFVVEHGADYEISKGFKGRSETIVIVFNPAIIKSVTPVKASDVKVGDFEQSINEVKIDNKNGAGATPNNEEIDYFGFRILMKPSTFLKLAASMDSDQGDRLVNYVKDGGAIASPFLRVKIPDEWGNAEYSTPASIASHEGRHRMIAVQKVDGDLPIEVHMLFAGGLRARNIKPEWFQLMNNEMYSEEGNLVKGPIFQLKK
jgi:hypothetical protein